jgi:CubicO group peptidase (beta-lactamase class C family)
MLHGTTIFQRSIGVANSATGQPATQYTRFRVGSVSKLLTAVTTARLVQSGLVDLDAPIQRYLPDYPVASAPITPRLLAGHLGGLRHYGRGGGDYINSVSYPSVQASIAKFRNDSLVATPGSKYF